MKRIAAVFLLIFAGVCLEAQTLTWDIKFVKVATWETILIDEIINMKNGELFTLSFTPASDCFAYILVYDSERNISVEYNGPMKGGKEEYLEHYQIEGASGTDTFYVVMSLTPQKTLEDLIRAFIIDQSRRNGNAIYSEVVSLQKQASDSGKPPSAIIATAATNRGNPGTMEYATRFYSKNEYVTTIFIRH